MSTKLVYYSTPCLQARPGSPFRTGELGPHPNGRGGQCIKDSEHQQYVSVLWDQPLVEQYATTPGDQEQLWSLVSPASTLMAGPAGNDGLQYAVLIAATS